MMKNIRGCSWFSFFLLFCLFVNKASQSTGNHRSKRISSVYCSSNAQCKNGGTCIMDSCRCVYGYTGSYCGTRLECRSDSNCFQNGKCELDLQSQKSFCRCNQNTSFTSDGRYEGVFCQEKMPCHATGYCLNDGMCRRDSVVTDFFYCECRNGWAGSHCQEPTFCQANNSCHHGGICSLNRCLCVPNSRYTGHFCELEITPALNCSAQRFWAFNKEILQAKGAAKIVRSAQLGNVISLLRAGGGWVDLGHFQNSCLNDFSTCQQGMSFAFWLQFIDGAYVVSVTKANNTVLSVQVDDVGKLLIQLRTGFILWQIKRDCFPVGWFHLTVTWNNTKLLYYENGQLLTESLQAVVGMNTSLPHSENLLSVGSHMGQGGFSTMRMSDLSSWTRALSEQEVKQIYFKKFLSAYTRDCLSNPCPSNQWCEDDETKLNSYTCIKPAGFYCSFNSGYCKWQNASINDQHWKLFSRYGSLRHDHTGNTCSGSGKFLGLASQSKRSSDVISPTFPTPSAPGRNVSLSMWYYMKGWATKTLSIIIRTSAGNQTLFSVNETQSRQWKYLKTDFPVYATFQVMLRGELFNSGGIFVDDISVEFFNSPVISRTEKSSQSTTLHKPAALLCVAYYSFSVTWYRNNQPIKDNVYYAVLTTVTKGTKASWLTIKDVNCQRAGNYTCVATNEYGSDQRQFTVTIFDVPRRPTYPVLDPSTKQITWGEIPGFECLPKSHFVVEYKKRSALNWTTAGYFDSKTFNLINANKGEQYLVKIYAINSVGTSKTREVSLWTNIEPTGVQLMVNGTAIYNAEKIVVHRGLKVNIRCVVTAEPRPHFLWKHPASTIGGLTFYRSYRTSDIKWFASLDIKSMSCRYSGAYSSVLLNLLGVKISPTAIVEVLEPDPPKNFTVVFINITSVLISWSSYKCNGIDKPSNLEVWYRREGRSGWTGRLGNNPGMDQLVITDQFQYGTVYEFTTRLVYNGRVGLSSQPLKTRSPELKEIFYTVTVTILNKAYSKRLSDRQSVEFVKLGKQISELFLQALSYLPEPKKVDVISFEGPYSTVARLQLNIPYSNASQLQEGLQTFIRAHNKQNESLVIDLDSFTIIQLPELANFTMTTDFSGQAGTTMTIHCSAVGPTSLKFSWKRNRVTLRPSYRVKIVQYNSTCSVMTIRMTKKADSANYTCNVSKSMTSRQETVFVYVSESPKVKILPLVRTMFEGESATFHCGLSRGNTSRLNVTWYEKAENSQEKLISGNNDSLSLTVQGHALIGARNHVIHYRCTVRNADGVGSSPSATLVILSKGDTVFCASELSSGIMWSITAPGMSDIQRCPNAAGRAVRACLITPSGDAKWGQVDFSDCMSRQIKEIHNEVVAFTEGYIVNKTLGVLLENLESVTAPYSAQSVRRQMYEKDLKASVDALTKLIKYNAANKTKPLSNQHDISNWVKTSSNLLRLTNLPAWRNALKVQGDIAYQMVSALDEYGHHSTRKTNDINIETENVVLVAVKISTNSSASTTGYQLNHGQSFLYLPLNLFRGSNHSVTVVSVFFKTLDQVLSSTEALAAFNTSFMNDSDWFFNSRVASITMRPRPSDIISPPFRLALETQKVTPTGSNRVCVFLNITTPLTRTHNNTWSTDGCHVVPSRTNSTTTTCACDHMTLFAVLMDSGDKITNASHRITLSWITVVGCLLSLLGIMITLFVVFCFWKNLRSRKTIVLINLCVAIAVTDVLIIAMEIADIQNKLSCTVLAVLLHFFVLSIFCWMLSEGIQLYFSLVKVVGAAAHVNVRFFYCLGWGIPAFVVSVSLAATQGRGYADKHTCWLNTQNHVLWAFVAPALLIVSGNMVVFALVIYSMLSTHRLRKAPLARRFQHGLKASFVLLPLLGISWSFGVLTMTSDKIAFNYIFAIFNSLQGFLIFVFHCILNKQIRDAMSERKRKRTGLVTDSKTAQSNRKLSTTTDTVKGTSAQLSPAIPLKLLNLQLFKSEICPSPQPLPTLNRAYEQTPLSSAEASSIPPRAERDMLIQKNVKEAGEKKQEKETTSHVKDDNSIQISNGTVTPSLNECDMDEKDMTSSESSLESMEFRGFKNPTEERRSSKMSHRCPKTLKG